MIFPYLVLAYERVNRILRVRRRIEGVLERVCQNIEGVLEGGYQRIKGVLERVCMTFTTSWKRVASLRAS